MADLWSHSYKEIFEENIDDLFGEQCQDLSAEIENWTLESSGWNVHSILRHQLFISKTILLKEVHVFQYLKN